MSNAVNDARHLTYSNLEMLWQGGAALIIPVQGNPLCELEFDPASSCITLVTDYQTPEPKLAMLQNISFEPVCVDGRDVARITVRVDHNVHGAYGLLAAIADELQLKNSPLAAAVAAGVEQYKDIFTLRTGLTTEEEVGLVGELMFLGYLIRTIGCEPALGAWRGPFSEEHDFVFDGIDLEIKTTASERRRHIIVNLTQLVPRVGASLALLSIQVTRGGGTTGQTLAGFVAQARSVAGGHVVDFDRQLASSGWSAEDTDLYTTRWMPRNLPRAYLVDADFPAITASALASVIPNAGLLSDVSYRVDVTDLEHYALPAPFAEFVESKGK